MLKMTLVSVIWKRGWPLRMAQRILGWQVQSRTRPDLSGKVADGRTLQPINTLCCEQSIALDALWMRLNAVISVVKPWKKHFAGWPVPQGATIPMPAIGNSTACMVEGVSVEYRDDEGSYPWWASSR